MSLDPSIILGYRPPQIDNPIQQYGNALAIQNASNQNALAQYQLARAKREDEDNAALRQSLSGVDISTPEGLASARNALLRIGNVAGAQDLDKRSMESQKLRGEITAQDIKAASDRLNAFSSIIAPLAMKPDVTHEDVMAAGNRAQSLGLIPNGWQQSVPMNAMQLPEWIKGIALSTEQGRKSLDMLLPKVSMQDLGGTVQPFNTNPLAGAVGPLAGSTGVAKTVTPGELLTDERTRSEGEKNRNVQIRGQNLVDARAGQTYDPERGVIVNTRQGTATPVTANGQPLPAKLPESSKKEIQGIDAQSNTINEALQALKDAPDAFGFVRGLATMGGTLSETAANAMSSDKNIQARSTVFNIVSKIINERAGAAQSAQELARLRAFLPAETDSAAVIESKLKGFQKYLGEQRKAFANVPTAQPRGASGEWKVEVEK